MTRRKRPAARTRTPRPAPAERPAVGATIALVGRPNVGKSTLFNRIVGGRPALVHDTPGLTRDRRYGEVDYFGRILRVIDTGGLDPIAATDVIGAGIHRQAERAIDEADALILVVDGTVGLAPLDLEVAARLRVTGKPIVLVVNKIDHPKRDDLVHDFHRLGLGEPFAISAAHGRGVDHLLEVLTDKLVLPPPVPEYDEDDDEPAADDDPDRDQLPRGPLRVAFVGRPNAGKSSLTNRLVGEERSLVHPVAGTTTDPVDSPFSFGGQDYLLIDTAGIRRKAKVDADVERIAVSMAIGQIERADVVVLVIDAALGPHEQDARLAGMITDAGRGLVIALNKSDLVKGEAARAQLREQVADNFHFLDWAPVHSMSAQRGDGVDKLMDLVGQVAIEHRRRVQTSELNRFFAEVCETTPPPIHRGRSVRIHYLTQGGTRPPTFILWANQPEGLSPAYRRFIVNQLRQRWGFRGVPLRIIVRARAGSTQEHERLARNVTARKRAKAKRPKPR
jgi:GTP-binding protein